jgi:hypothetical protein
MQTLPADLLDLIVVFQPLFTKPTLEHAKILLLDDTVERRGGKKIKRLGCCRDPVRSSKKQVIKCKFQIRPLREIVAVGSTPTSHQDIVGGSQTGSG